MESALYSGSSGLGSGLGWDIILCSWARHLTVTVLIFTQVYKWVLANLMLGQSCNFLASHPGGSRNTNLLVAWNTVQAPAQWPTWFAFRLYTQLLLCKLFQYVQDVVILIQWWKQGNTLATYQYTCTCSCNGTFYMYN